MRSRRLLVLGLVIAAGAPGTACGGGVGDALPVDAAPPPLDADAGPCDPAAQTGCRSDQKCTFVDPEADGFTTACRPVTGAIVEGATCTRGPGGFGDDDCAAGLFCTFIGVLPPDQGGTRVCRAICNAGEACASGQTCARLTDAPVAGMCGPSCAPFAATCSDGMTCAELWSGLGGDLDLFAVCRPPGTGAAGTACASDVDCVADHVCLALPGAPRVCRPLCDAEHACATGECFQPSGGPVGACF